MCTSLETSPTTAPSQRRAYALVWADEPGAHRSVVSLKSDYQIIAAAVDEQMIKENIYDLAMGKTPFVSVDIIKGTSQRVRECLEFGEDARKVASDPNAGGQSIVSEAFSMEHLSRRFGARHVVTEMEITYWNYNWKKVDYLCDIRGNRIGVSVSRAMGFPTPDRFKFTDAERLVKKKLRGLLVAMQGVDDDHRQDMAILHIFCQTQEIAGLMQLACLQYFNGSDDGYGVDSSGILVLLTVCESIPEIFEDDHSVLANTKGDEAGHQQPAAAAAED